MQSDVRTLLDRLCSELQTDLRGQVADYIPELSSADPACFSLAVCDVKGTVTSVGTIDQSFTAQSMCKPLLYAAALEEFGRDEVHRYVGMEPAGAAFDALIRLDAQKHFPHNPMLNSGAIAVCSLLATKHDADWLLSFFRHLVGHNEVHVDIPVYLSERATADRNRAIAYLLRYFKGLASPVEDALDLYFQACSILVTTQDMAIMAAVLANGGRSPSDGEALLSPETTHDVLAVMSTCGLYDGSGQFIFDVGMPAKSGVSGGVFAISPGNLGIAAYSPLLDEHGNSVRGVRAVHELSRSLRLHMFEPSAVAHAASEADIAREPELLAEAYDEARPRSEGAVADYSDGLAAADPNLFAISLCSIDGREHSVGDAHTTFSMQGTANPFTYALALETCGPEQVHQKVGLEPSGNPFFAIRFDPDTHRPYNPLGNAGAIAISSLLPGKNGTARHKELLAFLSRLAGAKRLPVHAGIMSDERRSGDRNRAIAHLLHNVGLIDDVDSALELYFQQCAVMVDCIQLARMAAVLATGGMDPMTGERILHAETVRSVLSVMYMCGLHDTSGRFAFEVGLPAKSGASGAIVAVEPGRYGLAVYSPPIDEAGTSVRGKVALEALARGLRYARANEAT